MYLIVVAVVLLSALNVHGDTKLIPCPVDQVICPHHPFECCRLEEEFCYNSTVMKGCENAFDDDETDEEQRKVICCQVLNKQFPYTERIPELQRVCTYRLGLLSWNSTCNEDGKVDKDEVDKDQGICEKAAGCSGVYPTDVTSDEQKKKFCCDKLNAMDETSIDHKVKAGECVVRTCKFCLGAITWKGICSGGDKEKSSGIDKGSSTSDSSKVTAIPWIVFIILGIIIVALIVLVVIWLRRPDLLEKASRFFKCPIRQEYSPAPQKDEDPPAGKRGEGNAPRQEGDPPAGKRGEGNAPRQEGDPPAGKRGEGNAAHQGGNPPAGNRGEGNDVKPDSNDKPKRHIGPGRTDE